MDDIPPRTEGLTGAGFWIRAGARAIDIFYAIILGYAGGILAGIALVVLSRQGLIASDWQNRLRTFNFIGLILSSVGSILYQTIAEGLYGASLGKLILQLRVVTEELKPISVTQALKRNIAYLWDALFFGLIAYSKMRESDLNQRNGDHWAHTLVVRYKDVPAESREGSEIFVLAFLIGSVGIVFFDGLGVILHVK